jgi:two-component system, OmpR family, alkaline phosphatase synthesis response regulator PhoP
MQKDIKILIVDDEEDILEFLEYNLVNEGYQVRKATGGIEALEVFESFGPDLMIIDIMMPELNGIEVCEKIRSNPDNNDVIIAFLTARSESFTQISALDAGGDDFITKPIKPNVFKSRVTALLRRHPKMKSKEQSDLELEFGDLKINLNEYSVVLSGEEMGLAKKEFELLALLVSKPGKVFKRAEILNKVWGADVIVGDRTIDVHVRKLREKLGSNYIQTLKGVGYKFNY